MVKRTTKDKAPAPAFLRTRSGGESIPVLMTYSADEALTGPKNTWLEIAYHEGYLTRRKFRELKRRYEKVHALMSSGREVHPV